MHLESPHTPRPGLPWALFPFLSPTPDSREGGLPCPPPHPFPTRPGPAELQGLLKDNTAWRFLLQDGCSYFGKLRTVMLRGVPSPAWPPACPPPLPPGGGARLGQPSLPAPGLRGWGSSAPFCGDLDLGGGGRTMGVRWGGVGDMWLGSLFLAIPARTQGSFPTLHLSLRPLACGPQVDPVSWGFNKLRNQGEHISTHLLTSHSCPQAPCLCTPHYLPPNPCLRTLYYCRRVLLPKFPSQSAG